MSLGLNSVCEECDRNRTWGGTSGFLPHTDEFHAQERRRLTKFAKILMTERLAVRLGHKITIRFNQDWAWCECSCGAEDVYRWWGSGRARRWGHNHLWTIGHGVLQSDERAGQT